MTMATTGRVDLILGPMFAGKSEELMRLLRRQRITGNKIILVKSKKDTRDNDPANVYTHNGTKFDAVSCNFISDIAEELSAYDVIGIDEGQFFADLVPAVRNLKRAGKRVVIAALHADYLQRSWKNGVLELIPDAFDVFKLHAVCKPPIKGMLCGKDANNSFRVSGDTEQFVIDCKEESKYTPLCDACYIKYTEWLKP